MRKKSYLFIILFLSSFIIGFSSFNAINTVSLKIDNEIDASSIFSSAAPVITWDNNGTAIVNKDASPEYGYVLCPDKAGGAIIAWVDQRRGAGKEEIYAQRITLAGQKLWGDNGTLICNATGTRGGQSTDINPEIAICSDGAGGAFITWVDVRAGNSDIYVQHINSAGTPKWPYNGTIVCNETTEDLHPKICSDGDKGAIITWQHFVAGGTDSICAQRFNSTGGTEWGYIYNGTFIISRTGSGQMHPQICSDENGGAVIAWLDFISLNWFDIYAQKINATGSLKWTNYGVLISNETNHQGTAEPQTDNPAEYGICSDGNGGAILAWRDHRNGDTDNDADIYAQRVLSNGVTDWTINGTAICNITSEQEYPRICSNGAGGAIITWTDNRYANFDIYAQRINSIGETLWTDNGTVICNAGTMAEQKHPQICVGGSAGAIITWEDFRDAPTSYNIYAQLIESDGQTQWTDNGTLICNYGTLSQSRPRICSDESGGAIIAWRDNRDDASGDVYAQKITYLSRGSVPLDSGDDDDDDHEAPIVPYGNFYLVFLAIGIVFLSIYTMRKLKSNK